LRDECQRHELQGLASVLEHWLELHPQPAAA
jgi:hypothetical protein